MRILSTELRLRVKNRKPRPFMRAASADATVGDSRCSVNQAFDDADGGGAGGSFSRAWQPLTRFWWSLTKCASRFFLVLTGCSWTHQVKPSASPPNLPNVEETVLFLCYHQLVPHRTLLHLK